MDRNARELRSELRTILEASLKTAPGGHDLSHTLRVISHARRILRRSNGSIDANVVLIAAHLHDIGRTSKIGNHAFASILVADRILTELAVSPDIKEHVFEAIKTHPIGSNPETAEAMILFDADKLDLVGPLGIARWFLILGEEGGTLLSACDRYLAIGAECLRLRGSLFFSPGGRELGHSSFISSMRLVNRIRQHV